MVSYPVSIAAWLMQALLAALAIIGCNAIAGVEPPVGGGGAVGAGGAAGAAAGTGPVGGMAGGVGFSGSQAGEGGAAGGSISCQTARDCAAGYCIDGVCCNEACNADCEACNVPGSVGYCQGIGSDDSCIASQACPASSACVDYSSSAGACAGRGSCSASSCVPAYRPAGTPCGAGSTGQCDGGGACIGPGLPLGSACQTGDECTEGFCAPTAGGTSVCCNQACNGTCQQCSALGQCNEAPGVDSVNCTVPECPADDVCHDYPDTPTEPRCASFGTCLGSEACAPTDLRVPSECTCSSQELSVSFATDCKLTQGAACSTADSCESGFCNNGVCCESACDGTCEQCQPMTGLCGQIDGCQCAVGDTTTCAEQFGSRGECAARTITCSGSGRWPSQQCNAQSAELCNNDNRDEDCNGDPRNGCACLNGTLSSCREQRRSQGVCANRILTCQNGQWPTAQCNATSAELCNNELDDDCDGAVNENPPCAPQFDGDNCDFQDSRCDSLRCSQCGGCDACVFIVECVDDHPGCATANDPVCRGEPDCAEVIAIGDESFFGSDISATQFAAQYINCACTQ